LDLASGEGLFSSLVARKLQIGGVAFELVCHGFWGTGQHAKAGASHALASDQMELPARQERLFSYFSPLTQWLPVSSKRLKDDLLSLINCFAAFPVSYNHVLVRGIMAYCVRLLKRFPDADHTPRHILDILVDIHRQISALYSQNRPVPSGFALLDLRLLEDRFDILQRKCAAGDILAPLDETPVNGFLAE
jgi:hypothetical protein